MVTSRLTSKAQTTIPQAVRTALGLKTGDELAYVIEDGRAILLRYVPDQSFDEPFATFSEWNSKADFEAYGGLRIWDVVKIPFPYTNRLAAADREAVRVQLKTASGRALSGNSERPASYRAYRRKCFG